MKYLLLLSSLFITLQISAQEKGSSNDTLNNYNRWTVEAMTGFSDGNYSYGTGFNPGDSKHVLSHFKINNFDLGLRYMVTPKFGFKASLAYGTYTDSDKTSLSYETEHYNLAFQGVVNAARVLDFSPASRIGLLLHGGIHVGSLKSKTNMMFDPVLGQVANPNYNNTEYHGGFVAGITPQLRITSKLALFADVSMYYNYRQHMNWDGTTVTNGNLKGKNTNLSLGLSYSFGSDKMHGDWKEIKSQKELELAYLSDKVEEIELMMQDTDRDGVPDYLDVEPNTVGGVAVDTKGRAIDVNKNGVPDELEPRDGKKDPATYDKDALNKALIEEGIINVFFDTDKDTPNEASANSIYYIINFLKNNKGASVRVKGYADSTGSESHNADLAKRRAQNVTNFITQSGVDASRLEIVGQGEDKTMDESSKTGLQLARRVSFELIKK
ncbi:OmpA family protein [Flavobacterium ardleyense]|uniref:OmpA family protein n=1 Tax=Flavobacterium ardleyense TaxID=2038737 RepID=A0ABW5Z3B3_9FLAO